MPTETPNSYLINTSRHVSLAAAFDIMASGLGDFVSKQMSEYFRDEPSWTEAASSKLGRPSEHGSVDPLFQLLVMRRFWGPVFSRHYREDLRDIITDLVDCRNLWAHFNLPEEIEVLDRAVLSMERLLAPINPDSSIQIRQIRLRLKHPAPQTTAPPAVDVQRLHAELEETQEIFESLKETNGDLSYKLDASRRASANKQLQLDSLKNQLKAIQGKSLAVSQYLEEERSTRNRIEWLFVGLLVAVLAILIISIQS